MVLPHIGGPELVIIALIVILLFGVGRISKIGKEMGSAISAFKKGLKEDNKVEEEK